jgi:hypothetical protein
MDVVEEKVDELIKAAVAVKAALGGLKEQIEAEAEQGRKRARQDSSPPAPHTHCAVRIAPLLTKVPQDGCGHCRDHHHDRTHRGP